MIRRDCLVIGLECETERCSEAALVHFEVRSGAWAEKPEAKPYGIERGCIEQILSQSQIELPNSLFRDHRRTGEPIQGKCEVWRLFSQNPSRSASDCMPAITLAMCVSRSTPNSSAPTRMSSRLTAAAKALSLSFFLTDFGFIPSSLVGRT